MGENISTRVAYGLALEEFGDRDNVYVFDADLKSCTMTQYFRRNIRNVFLISVSRKQIWLI